MAQVRAKLDRGTRRLLEDALSALERSGCQFWACAGPTLRPEHMRTCYVCSMVARLRRKLGKEVRPAEEVKAFKNRHEPKGDR